MWVSTRISKGEVKGGVYIFRTIFIPCFNFISFNSYREAVVISVKNLSGFLSVNADGSWVCEGGSKHKTERLPDPVSQIFFK
jgi:hypothetical protein